MSHYRVLPPVLDASREASAKYSAMYSLSTQEELRQQVLRAAKVQAEIQGSASTKLPIRSRIKSLQSYFLPSLLVAATLVTLSIYLFV
ncbi:hypothetical protein [Undibacterium macrobrachii]|jgi:hypothetical protein|uniref:hypothetical protein n=1 Tax=Undibacterium macrobrachii TaxID=1119058 RepID=UPI0016744FB8|nr:hypothetical protein [Undibacterium macrobrachii]